MFVTLLHNGYCNNIAFTRGQTLDLPQETLDALGKDAYVKAAKPEQEEKAEKVETPDANEDKSVGHAPADKQVKSSTNK